jgi:hypothetical protein
VLPDDGDVLLVDELGDGGARGALLGLEAMVDSVEIR